MKECKDKGKHVKVRSEYIIAVFYGERFVLFGFKGKKPRDALAEMFEYVGLSYCTAEVKV